MRRRCPHMMTTADRPSGAISGERLLLVLLAVTSARAALAMGQDDKVIVDSGLAESLRARRQMHGGAAAAFDKTGCQNPQLIWGRDDGLRCLRLPATPVGNSNKDEEGRQFFPFSPSIKDPVRPVGIASFSDEDRGGLFFSDSQSKKVYFVLNTWNNNLCGMSAGSNRKPRSLAVDYASRQLYFTDANKQKPAVCVATLSMSMVTDVVLADLQEPEDIALAPEHGLLFFSDQTKKSIERANMDGSRRKVLLKGDFLVKPRGLAISQQLLFFADGGRTGGSEDIGIMNFDGRLLRILFRVKGPNHPFGLAAVSNQVYVTDIGKNIVCRVPQTAKSSTSCEALTTQNTTRNFQLSDLIALTGQPSTVTSPCTRNNGGVQQFCLTYSHPEQPGQLLVRNGCPDFGPFAQCALVDSTFRLPQSAVSPWQCTEGDSSPRKSLVYTTKQSVRRLDIDPKTFVSTRLSFNFANEACLQLASSSAGDVLYGAHRNGTQILRISVSGEFSVVTSRGGKIQQLTVDKHKKDIFWVDATLGYPSIVRALLSNLSSPTVIYNVSSPSVQIGPLTVYDSSRRLYFVQHETAHASTLHYMNLSSRSLVTQLIVDGLAWPSTLVIDGDWLYIADSLMGRILRLNVVKGGQAQLQLVSKNHPQVSGLLLDGNYFYWTERLNPEWRGTSLRRACLDGQCATVELDSASNEICSVGLFVGSPAPVTSAGNSTAQVSPASTSSTTSGGQSKNLTRAVIGLSVSLFLLLLLLVVWLWKKKGRDKKRPQRHEANVGRVITFHRQTGQSHTSDAAEIEYENESFSPAAPSSSGSYESVVVGGQLPREMARSPVPMASIQETQGHDHHYLTSPSHTFQPISKVTDHKAAAMEKAVDHEVDALAFQDTAAEQKMLQLLSISGHHCRAWDRPPVKRTEISSTAV